jgi:hypothetical protein
MLCEGTIGPRNPKDLLSRTDTPVLVASFAKKTYSTWYSCWTSNSFTHVHALNVVPDFQHLATILMPNCDRRRIERLIMKNMDICSAYTRCLDLYKNLIGSTIGFIYVSELNVSLSTRIFHESLQGDDITYFELS